MKVVTVVGTRPEIIRLAATIKRFDATFEHVLVHTGQNWDHQLNQVFFDELGLRRPDHYLNVDTSSLGHVLGETLIKTEEVLRLEQPDAFVVLGDTNSAISSVIAKRMHIPVYHLEAGNRSFDENVPEETNRRLVDHVADFNLVYTEHARRNLLAEGLHPRRIVLIGSPLREVLEMYRPQIDASTVLERLGLTANSYFLVSAHREENVDSPNRLAQLVEVLEAVAAEWRLPVLVSTHPRTRQRLRQHRIATGGNIMLHEPFGFFDYNRLQLSAKVVLSDSGSISEESAIVGFRAITLRGSIERPEALEAGTIIMTDLNVAETLAAIEREDTQQSSSMPFEYQILNTSQRVVSYMMSTAGRHADWSGIREPH
ncbi:non-hydrolyzing UDP-N-acetylglucosamine 2-epimerase [Desertimonas flava]|uniref:non-hydrolyzing UDP-N-acetylglucosamine 2-epimerase n=1 Tax=Desertimonas flava TaxID=2064846 RepID=UPI000E344AE0|nr:UDP-N-acetylglucosamine 2-epimerase (non-hydrolyzing) [Desertimonas flava]